MGLATVYGAVKQHGGWIEVESAPGYGTAIRTFFPPSANGIDSETPARENPLTSSTPSETITILAVEDEEMLREFVEQALKTLGYRVLTARNGREALKIWAEHRDEIDLLLTDVVMPESISGRQLAHTLSVDKPDLKIVFTSGYSAELLGPDFEDEKQYRFLPKPYLPERLASTLSECLKQQTVGLN